MLYARSPEDMDIPSSVEEPVQWPQDYFASEPGDVEGYTSLEDPELSVDEVDLEEFADVLEGEGYDTEVERTVGALKSLDPETDLERGDPSVVSGVKSGIYVEANPRWVRVFNQGLDEGELNEERSTIGEYYPVPGVAIPRSQANDF